MRLACGWWVACCVGLVSAAAGCTTGMDMPRRDANGGDEDAGRDGGGGMDSGARTCTTAAMCDDGFPCTIDNCVAGNVCEYTPLSSMCAAGENCVIGRGCVMDIPSVCETSDDCSDGNFCNGVEQCLGPAGSRSCVRGADVDCDDGNACTVDSCDEAEDGCTYAPAPGCDAGPVVGVDGGIPCDPFDPTMHYTGTFGLSRPAVSACTGSATYNISEVTFSVSGGALRVQADRFSLTQTPAPTDGTFDVSFSDSCASFRLTGTFSCANRWAGTWTASFGGGLCSTCSPQNLMERGTRR